MQFKKDLQREDCLKLVKTFYTKVRKDELLSPIFNHHVKDWDHHEEHISKFWDMSLFGGREFFGKPLMKHFQVDEQTPIDEEHFQRWLDIWYSNIDSMFIGKKADEAKHRASLIGNKFLSSILTNRHYYR